MAMLSPAPLKTVAYTSLARLDLGEDELRQLHQQARHLNALDGITGLLMFDGTRFLQIVEGTEEAIDDLVERLRRDSRHSGFEIRDERMVGSRSFPDWNMEMVQVGAGYPNARCEIASLLPSATSDGVRELALRMSDALSRGA
jgi:hypothetical protein